MSEFDYCKRDIHFSHYTGALRQNILDYSKLISETTNDKEPDLKEIKEFAELISQDISKLSSLIAHLDKLNELKTN